MPCEVSVNKYRNYKTPKGWCFDQSYESVMQLRSAYNAGIRSADTKEAARIYIKWVRSKKRGDNA